MKVSSPSRYNVSVYTSFSLILTVFITLLDKPLLGLRHRNETTPGELPYVSMAGGLEFFIDGAGMDQEPHINSVMFQPTQSDPVDLVGPPLNSKCLNSVHKITLPSVTI